MYVTRDKDGTLYLFRVKPLKNLSNGTWEAQDFDLYELIVSDSGWDDWMFSEVKWEDEEPTEIQLVKK